MAEKKIWVQQELTCKPLDTYEEILMFLQDPPPWRTLCKEFIPHSETAIKNIDVNKYPENILLEHPLPFCHFDPDAEDVKRDVRKNLPKTLVCHDMANGYHDDSMIDGTGNYDAYTFYNWAAIDIFIYFSHHLITIPPLGWINVGHAHGVKVLGTLITEWGEGIAFWDRVLQSETEWQNLASALVAIAKTLNFDGWLLNVENKVTKPAALLRFVEYLHSTLHQELDEPVLVWYDSVTVDGHLNWQNGLNDKNSAFFDVVDGFFTNYSWREADVRASAEAAAGRLHDLYVGVDVWGRNFYGGGQFNTQEAIQLVHSYGCSVALFAPAWTHEAMAERRGDANAVAEADQLDRLERFLLRDRAFWGSIWPYLLTRLPCRLPFQTSFCRGQGKKRRLYGEVICPVPWYNLRHMQYQPNSALGPHGYLLSTVDNIVGLSRLGLLKNKNGIIRYRRSVEHNALNEPADLGNEIVLSLRADSIGDVHEEAVEEPSEEVTPHEERKSVKRKMTRVLRHFFRIKSAKTEDEDEDAVDGMDEEHRPSTSAGQVRGRSMVQMSVNLRLGDKTSKTRYALGFVPNELECLEQFYEDSFLGGSCLKINPSDEISQEHRLSRLFFSDFHVRDGLIACVVVKTLPGHENQFLNVLLYVESGGNQQKVVLVGRSIPHKHEESSGAETLNEYPLEAGDPELRSIQEFLLLQRPGFYVPLENAYEWRVRYYDLDLKDAVITSVNLRTGLDVGPVLLGHFGLCEKTTQ